MKNKNDSLFEDLENWRVKSTCYTVLHVNSTCQFYMSILHVNSTCQFYMSILHVNSTCHIYMANLYVKSICQFYKVITKEKRKLGTKRQLHKKWLWIVTNIPVGRKKPVGLRSKCFQYRRIEYKQRVPWRKVAECPWLAV